MTVKQNLALSERSIGASSVGREFLSADNVKTLFAVCLVGLTFKQLQFYGSIGPFEIATVALCVVITLASVVSKSRWPTQTLFVAGILIGCVLLSSALAWAANPGSVSVREIAAYIFTALIVVSFCQIARDDYRLALERVALAIGGYLLLCALWWLLPGPLNDLVSYPGNGKLQGLSNNPNQIAFLAVVGICLLYMLRGNKRFPIGAIALSAAMGAAAAFSGSSAFTLAMSVGLATGLIFAALAFASKRKLAHFPWVFILPLVFAVAALPIGHSGAAVPKAPDAVASQAPDAVASQSSSPDEAIVALLEADGGEGSIRIELWSQALEQVMSSPFFGLGPGAHVPLLHPLSGETSYNEAHNTVLDIALVTGGFGLLVVGAVVAGLAVRSSKAGNLGSLLVILGAMGSFSMFHYIGRQPLSWIIILSCFVIFASEYKNAGRSPHL